MGEIPPKVTSARCVDTRTRNAPSNNRLYRRVSHLLGHLASISLNDTLDASVRFVPDRRSSLARNASHPSRYDAPVPIASFYIRKISPASPNHPRLRQSKGRRAFPRTFARVRAILSKVTRADNARRTGRKSRRETLHHRRVLSRRVGAHDGTLNACSRGEAAAAGSGTAGDAPASLHCSVNPVSFGGIQFSSSVYAKYVIAIRARNAFLSAVIAAVRVCTSLFFQDGG